MAERPGFMLYFDIEPALEMLDDSQRGKLFSAIIEYAHYASIPSFEDRLIGMAWSLIKPSLDRDRKSYDKKVLDNTIKGLKSHFKRNYAPKRGIDPEDEDAMLEYINQQLSTTVDQCPPTEHPTITQQNGTLSPSLMSKGKGAGKGNPEADFNQRRNDKIRQLQEYSSSD